MAEKRVFRHILHGDMNRASKRSTPGHATSARSHHPSCVSSPSSTHTPPPRDAVAMGQSESTVSAQGNDSEFEPTPRQQPSTATSLLKFSWPGRKKKSEDSGTALGRSSRSTVSPIPPVLLSTDRKGKVAELPGAFFQDPLASSSISDLPELTRPPSRSSAKLTLQFASSTLNVLKGKLNSSQASVSATQDTVPRSLSPPAPPPPRTDHFRSSTLSDTSTQDWVAIVQGPLPRTSMDDSLTRHSESNAAAVYDETKSQRRERREQNPIAREIIEDRRKSDSTLRTVRLVGSRTPRPRSIAESSNSGHTILPGTGSPSANIGATKRLSALMTDIDFGMPEIDSEDDDDSVLLPDFHSASSSKPDLHDASFPQTSSNTSFQHCSPSTRKDGLPRRDSNPFRIRRFAGGRNRHPPADHTSSSESDALSSSVSTSGLRTANSSTTSVTWSPCVKDLSMFESRPSLEVASSSSTCSDMSGIHDSHLRYYQTSKLEPWFVHGALDSQSSLATSTSTSSQSNEMSNASIQSQEASSRSAQQRSRLQSIQTKGFRQTAVSFSANLAPAMGFKKAVDKLGRAFANSSVPHDSATTVSSPISHGPSASAASFLNMMGRNGTENSLLHHQVENGSSGHHKKMKGHTPGSQSLSLNFTSKMMPLSDSDNSGGQGINLGRLLRMPIRPRQVFGRDLISCVRDTGLSAETDPENKFVSLDGRLLPALIVRCAQHIVKWGIQEEGLFRISGRSRHIAKLRAEFDSGADYDLRECGPGDIDPHAVSSVFKAFLRELPEPLLTRDLSSEFEAALAMENSTMNAATSRSLGVADVQSATQSPMHHRLPSGPKDTSHLHKAPSLSTFAVPVLVPRNASTALLNTLSILISRLPQENRDLLRTVTELIKATASCSKETKMPLSNLLLVFCPSLLMSPPLLRVLCEYDNIWEGPLEKLNHLANRENIDPIHSSPKAPSCSSIEKNNSLKGRRPSMSANDRPAPAAAARTVSEGSQASEIPPRKEDVANDSETSAAPPSSPPISVSDKVIGHSRKSHESSPTSTNIEVLPGGKSCRPTSRGSNRSRENPSIRTASSGSHASGSPLVKHAAIAPKSCGSDNHSSLANTLSIPESSSLKKRHSGSPLCDVLDPFGLGSTPVTPLDRQDYVFPSTRSSPNVLSSNMNAPLGLPKRRSKSSLKGLITKRSISSLFQVTRTRSMADDSPMNSAVETSPPSSFATPRVTLDSPTLMGFGSLGLTLGNEEIKEESETSTSTNEIGKESLTSQTSKEDSTATKPPQATSMDWSGSGSSVFSNSVFYTPPTTLRPLAPTLSLTSFPSASSDSYNLLDFNLREGDDDEDWARTVLQLAAQ